MEKVEDESKNESKDRNGEESESGNRHGDKKRLEQKWAEG